MKNKIITKISTMDALALGNIEGLKMAVRDAEAFLTDGPEKEFFIKYLKMQIQNLQDGYGGRTPITLVK